MKILYIDIDNVVVDFPSGIDRLTEAERMAFDGRLDEVPHIFSKMDPIKGAVDTFHELEFR